MHKKIGDRGSWYPTSREKRARCGAPDVFLDVRTSARDSRRSVGICGIFRNMVFLLLHFHKSGVAHISLVFREMWDTTNLSAFLETA
jgi:hypothetical protein